MKQVFRLYRRNGIFYSHDSRTGKQESLKTRDKGTAQRLLNAKNEAAHNPAAVNLQIARNYVVAGHPEMLTRTWRTVHQAMTPLKDGDTRERWERVDKDAAYEALWDIPLIETQPEMFLKVMKKGTVSTNVFLRRMHNFALDMNWLLRPILPKKQWPRIKFKKKRAIKHEEHLRILAREGNPERRAFYELCWYLGGSQSDVAHLEAEDVDWTDWTVCYDRKKLASLDETDVKPPLITFGKKCAAVLRSLPQTGPLFPNLRKVKAKDRANEFRQRCQGLDIKGVTLHSYRYSWAERGRKAGYPRRQAEEALGHNSKAVHIAYAKRAQVTVASLEEYEELAAKKVVPVELGGANPTLPAARP